MKNILKYASLVIFAIVMLVILTGCGSDTIVATMDSSDPNIGAYKMKIEVMFEGDVISSVKTNMSFEDEKIANLAVSGESEDGIKMEKEGNTVYAELTAEEYKEMYDIDLSNMSKEEIIQQFKDEGFTVEE